MLYKTSQSPCQRAGLICLDLLMQDALAADFGAIAFDTSALEESLRHQAATLMLQRQSGEGGR